MSARRSRGCRFGGSARPGAPRRRTRSASRSATRTPDVYGNAALPNLQPPDVVVDGPHTSIAPIGFGPIAEQWPMRQARLSAQSVAWLERRYADMLPDDFDGDFFQASPADQRLEELRPNERIVLENLLRQHPRLVTSLPGHVPVAFVDAPGAAPFELRLVADTLWIDSDRGVCTVTWRGTLPLRDPAQQGRIVIGLSEPGTRLTWADLHRHRDPRTAQPSQVNEVAASRVKRPTLPFAIPSGGTIDVPSRPPPARKRDDMTETLTDEDDEFSGARTVLPFNRRPRGEGGSSAPLPAAGRPAQSAPPPPITQPPIAQPPIAPPAMAMPASANVDAAASPWATASPGRPPPVMGDMGRSAAYQPPPAPALASSPSSAAPVDNVSEAPRGGWGPPNGRSAGEPMVEFRRDVSDAAQRGVVAASNAAADAARTPMNESAASPARPANSEGERLAVGFDLFWYDAQKLPRMRSALAPRGSARFERDWSVPEGSDRDEIGARERGEVLRLLSRTQITDVTRVGGVLSSRGFDADGGFEPPIVVLAGELRVPFEKHEWLAAIAAIAAAFGSTDKKLKDALALATELAPAGSKAPPDLLDAAVARIREAFDGVYRGMSGPYLDARAERSLLVERRFQAREVFGQPCIRGELGGDARGPGSELPFYMPEALRQRWPLFSRLSIRAIVELRHREDEGETHAHAALALAVAREIRRS